ncbi:C4-dicarboxylate transporter DcuC [Turicimonas muris]|uniref:C4-dicarboxylate ABC transporter n=9 Tax=Turicimonas muris TaxID=1796652 RepID=A0A227KPF3_9BURK|nr:C4-dicarboxylate transporter DcuC [Turicimonas muris]ANU66204.1 C4-dicarboxylate ABC transporter [Burkholderiales bacterium YL45]OXE49858.1 C4-dicarboxylate ABC transporter [Turicimonas muris]QQQ97353.1 C4-dicarboxylate transporter DcuC [Turicimonas muris]
MTWTFWIAIAVVIATVYALVKRYETRLVLLTSGFVMAFISLQPMVAFKQFDKSMTNGSLIIAICSALGFAAVISLTKCDIHLVSLLMKPLKRLGLFLLPACMIVTSVISTAIPSMAGLSAAVGPTMIPIMIRAGFRPAMAAAAVGGCMMPAYLNPGVSHNPFISKLASMDIMEFIGAHASTTVTLGLISIICITITCFVLGDFSKAAANTQQAIEKASNEVEHPNILFAIAPIVPVVLLVVASIWFKELKMSVATAMLIGTFYALVVTRSNPEEVTKKFFAGMGNGYAKILGIIIAAGVFAAGLRAAGVIEVFVNYLTHANEVAKLGGSIGPFALAVLTGSGDAAAFAFNEAVTPHAAKFGMQIDNLGYLAMMAAGIGRQASPLAGGIILLSGIAAVSPVEVVKRTAPAAVVMLISVYFLC